MFATQIASTHIQYSQIECSVVKTINWLLAQSNLKMWMFFLSFHFFIILLLLVGLVG